MVIEYKVCFLFGAYASGWRVRIAAPCRYAPDFTESLHEGRGPSTLRRVLYALNSSEFTGCGACVLVCRSACGSAFAVLTIAAFHFVKKSLLNTKIIYAMLQNIKALVRSATGGTR
jgi:ferredoxin